MLEDSDGDFVADKRHVFADGLDFAHSIMPYRGGLLVGAKTKILHLVDEDGDNVADRREILFDGFQPAHPQMQIGNPRWGIDNWVYLNYGPGKVHSSREPERVVQLPRKDFRFHPQTFEFESDPGMGQFGNTVDRWGRRFYCTNRNPIITTFLPNELLKRNPYRVLSKAFYDVGKAGGETKVFPLVSMKSNYLSHAGTHTSACGTTAYLGDLAAGGKGFRDSVFVCEPIGHLVTRSIIESDGLRLVARRAEPNRDFLASTDTWFRPSSLATGPDGGLYLADMYRLWVEHPKFLPKEIAAKLDWRAGDDRGRIYRIVPKGANGKSYRAPTSIQEAVELLTAQNGWRQFTGQRLIVESQSKAVVPRLRELLNHENATTRLHAMWTLSGLDALGSDELVGLLDDKSLHVRADALRLASDLLDDEHLFRSVCKAAKADYVRIRYHAALALGESNRSEATRWLSTVAAQDGSDSLFVDGFLSSVSERSGAVIANLLGDTRFHSADRTGNADLIRRLAMVVGSRADMDEVADVLHLLTEQDPSSSWWEVPLIDGLAQGFRRHRGTRLSIQSIIAKPPSPLQGSVERLKHSLVHYQNVAANEATDIDTRVASIALLAYQSSANAEPVFRSLLSRGAPTEVQSACIAAMVKSGFPNVATVLIETWPNLAPRVRTAAATELLRRTDSIQKTLVAMEAGTIDSKVLGIDQRVRLLKHSNVQIRETAIKLFGGAVSSDREQVASNYAAALKLEGSFNRGREVFQRVCANCHRFNGSGHSTGPDLSDSANRSKAALLYDILDPNSKVEPRYLAQNILTNDGTVYRGLVASETADAVVLSMAGGKSATVRRDDIESLKVDEVSLMPVGIEKDVNVSNRWRICLSI